MDQILSGRKDGRGSRPNNTRQPSPEMERQNRIPSHKSVLMTPKDKKTALERWLADEITRRYEEFLDDPSIGIPAETVRARFAEKRHRQQTEAD